MHSDFKDFKNAIRHLLQRNFALNLKQLKYHVRKTSEMHSEHLSKKHIATLLTVDYRNECIKI